MTTHSQIGRSHTCGCECLSRRGFLARAGATALGLAAIPGMRVRLAGADEESGETTRDRKTILVTIFLRGGADGLNMVVPHGDEAYYRIRPTLAIGRPGTSDSTGAAIDLKDGMFGLHPALAPLAPLFAEGTAAAVHAVGHPAATRSHFEEQDRWETASDVPAAAEGWLNRYLATHAAAGPVRAIGFGTVLPRILAGKVPVQVVTALSDLALATPPGQKTPTESILSELYGDEKGGLASAGREGLEAVRILSRLDPARYHPASGAEYPASPFGEQIRQTALLIKEGTDLGLEIAELEIGGWDTHQNQGGAAGAQAALLADLAAGVAAFAKDMGDRMREILVLTLSEFGRTAHENGTGGTDHGHGSCLFAVGGSVAKGGVHGRWPGLGDLTLLANRDVAHTTDFRDVLVEVVESHLGVSAAEVFPGYRPTSVGLVKGA